MRKVLKAVLVLAIVGAGYGIYLYLKTSKDVPQRQAPGQRPTLVEVIPATPAEEPVTGGRFSPGQILVRIDPADYDIMLRQQQARVVQAKMELARERGLKSVAEREWKLIQDEVQPTAEGKKLALREIQMENARAVYNL